MIDDLENDLIEIYDETEIIMSVDEVYALMDTKVEKAIKDSGSTREHIVSYSAYPYDNDTPYDNLNIIAVQGPVIFEYETSYFFAGPKGKNYRSEILESPTWLDVSVIANEAIHVSNDFHHVFLENVDFLRKEEGISIYRLCFGS